MRALCLLTVGTILAACGLVSGQPQVLFYDDFEAGMSNWSPWEDVTDPPACCGPYMLFNDGSHAHHGTQAARQEQAQPWWYGSLHEEAGLVNDTDKIIRVSAWQFEDANRLAPQHTSHDQVQGWLALMNEAETEFFAIGVHAHWNSPEPLLDWWEHLSWATATDGWHTTTVPRIQGWRHLKIVAHPYTGSIGDVEFYVGVEDGEEVVYELVGSGQRLPGDNCQGVPVIRTGIGSSPAHVDEDYISNTYEFFWYDELEISTEDVAMPWISAWRSVRVHDAVGELGIELDAAATGSDTTSEPRRDGLQKIEVDFDADLSSCYTPGQVSVSGGLTVTGEALTNGGTTLEIDIAGSVDGTCYTIDVSGSIDCLADCDADCMIKVLAGNTNGDDNTNLIDMAQTKSMNGADPTQPGNARFDVNTDGNINLIDMALVKSLNGGSVTCP